MITSSLKPDRPLAPETDEAKCDSSNILDDLTACLRKYFDFSARCLRCFQMEDVLKQNPLGPRSLHASYGIGQLLRSSAQISKNAEVSPIGPEFSQFANSLLFLSLGEPSPGTPPGSWHEARRCVFPAGDKHDLRLPRKNGHVIRRCA